MSIFKANELENHHVLVTGATGGIGYETTKVLASMGAKVTITGRRQEKLQELQEEIQKADQSAQVHSIVCDLAKSDERDQLVKEAEQTFGPVTMLVNSAGITGGGKLEDLTQEEIEKVMYLNFTVPILLTQRLYASLKTTGKGAVVNVSSLSGLRGTYAGTAYTGSKFALNAFTQSFSLEAIEHGIRVNAVAPGYVNTDMGLKSIENRGKRENHSFKDQFDLVSANLPSGRITEPQEVANTIAFLLSSGAENIIGEIVKISGGGVL